MSREPQDTQPDPLNLKLPRAVVELKLPLWGILTAGVVVGIWMVNMYFTVIQTAREMTELQISVKAGNTQVTTLAGEQTLMRFRMDTLESDVRSIKQATQQYIYPPPPSNQQGAAARRQ